MLRFIHFNKKYIQKTSFVAPYAILAGKYPKSQRKISYRFTWFPSISNVF